MNKEELIETICKKEGLNIEVVGEDLSWSYDKIFSTIVETVASGKTVEVPGFGSFYRIDRHLRRTQVPSVEPKFRPDLVFMDAAREGGTNDY